MNKNMPLICILPYELRKTKNLGLVDLKSLIWKDGVRIPEGTVNDLNQNDHLIIYPSSNIWLANYNKLSPKISLIMTEPVAIHKRYYLLLSLLRKKFFRVFVRYTDTSKKYSNVIAMPLAESWVTYNKKSSIIKQKKSLISLIASNKIQLDGHLLRHQIVERISNTNSINIDFLGRAYKPFDKKEEGLLPYKFSIIIENVRETDYFTEKLLDCFICETIPIYWGADNIGVYFDIEGMLIFQNIDDLINILGNISDEWYFSRKSYIMKNLETAIELGKSSDRIISRMGEEVLKNP